MTNYAHMPRPNVIEGTTHIDRLGNVAYGIADQGKQADAGERSSASRPAVQHAKPHSGSAHVYCTAHNTCCTDVQAWQQMPAEAKYTCVPRPWSKHFECI